MRFAKCVLPQLVGALLVCATLPGCAAEEPAQAKPRPAHPDYSDLLALCFTADAGCRMPTEREIRLLGPFWPKVPPEKNAAYLLAKANHELTEYYKALGPEPPGSASSAEPYAGDAAGFIGYVRANQNVLDQIQKALPFPFEDAAFINDHAAGVWLASLNGSRHLGRFLLDAGFAAELDGKPALAAERYMDCLKLAANVRRNGPFIEYLVGNAMKEAGCSDLARLLANADLDDATLKRVIAVCRECECPPGRMEGALRAESDFAAAQDAIFGRHEAERMRELLSVVEKKRQLPLPEYLRSFEETSAELDKNYKFANGEGLAHGFMYARLAALRADIPLRALQIQAAVSLYRKAYAAPPETLDALVPAFLPAVPVDPFDGKPLRYARTAHGWKVWSVGDVLMRDFQHGSSRFVYRSDLPTNPQYRARRPAPIHDAAKAGDLAKVQALIKDNPALVFSMSNSGWTPLHFAAEAGQKAVAEFLLASQADVNAEDYYADYRPLHLAAGSGHKDVVELLLANKADVNAKDRRGQTALHRALRSNDVAELLLANKADVNATDYEGDTPLLAAARDGNRETVELLLAHKAGVNVKDNKGATPLSEAASTGRKDVVELLLANKAEVGNIYEAVAVGDLEKVKALLKDNPGSVSRKDGNGKTPLHFAAAMDQRKSAEMLLADKADVNATDNYGRTALHEAAVRGSEAVAELLLANKTDVNARDRNSYTPLHEAVRSGSKAVAELLLANKAEVNARDYEDCTPLHEAARMSHKAVAELLLANKAEVNAKDKRGWTPLHWTAWTSNKEIAELLLANKADVTIKDKNGETLLQYAVKVGHTEIADLLRQHGAKE